MGKLYLVRHGESDLNRAGVYFGHLDPELNENGRKQAKRSYKILKDIEFDRIVSTDLKRGYQTAEILSNNKKSVEKFKDLRELNFGIFEGYSYQELKEKYPEELIRCEKEWKTYNYVTGESLEELQKRVINFIEREIDLDKTNLMVTHWGVINVILSFYFSKGLDSYWKYSVENGGIVEIEFNEGYPILKGLNIGE